jgi:tetratricopeptide (TPR) repeat protein
MLSLPTAPSRPPRRHRVPPALTRGTETLPVSPVLDEVPGELGVVLWRSARNVSLWSATPAERRARLFDPRAAGVREAEIAAAGVEAELLAPLSVVVRLLEAPGGMDGPRVVNACRRIALWAEQRGALGTALEFAQAAALASPHQAALAYTVGRLARRRAEYDRAESWLARAVIQARRSEDWRTYALAYSGLGNLNVQKGNFPLARRAHERCLKTALRHSLGDLEGSAYHDLFLISVETGDDDDAQVLAERAFSAYGPLHANLPRLAFDVTYYWILKGFFQDALRVARPLAACFETPCDQALALSLVTRSAGGVGDRRSFALAREPLDRLLGSGSAFEAAARALLGVSYGAASLGEWEMARAYADRALQAAAERKEGRLVMAAEAALGAVLARSAGVGRPGQPAVTRLANDFVEALGSGAGLVSAG